MPCPWDELSRWLIEADLVINTLPPTAYQSLAVHLPAAVSASTRWLDLSYGADLQSWIEHLRSRGFAAEDGLRVLIYQGITSFALWTTHKVPFSVGENALKDVIHSHSIDS